MSSWVGRLDYRLVIALMCSKLEGVPMEALSWALVRLSTLRLLLRFRLPLGERFACCAHGVTAYCGARAGAGGWCT